MSALIDMGGYAAVGHQNMGELAREAQDAFAAVLDYTRDCMDVCDVASRTEMLTYGDDLQGHVDALEAAGHRLFMARRKAALRPVGAGGVRSLPLDILYLVTVPAGASPTKVAVMKEMESGLG